MFTLAICCLTMCWFTLIHGPNIPSSYAIWFFTTSDFNFTTTHIHYWELCLLWLSLFILSGAISLLFPSSILNTYWPGGLIFQCRVFCLFIPFKFVGFSQQEYWSGLPFPLPVDHALSELSSMTHPSWVALHGMAHSFIELDEVWSLWSVWLVSCDCSFHSVCPLMDKDKRLMEASGWERLTVGEIFKWIQIS